MKISVKQIGLPALGLFWLLAFFANIVQYAYLDYCKIGLIYSPTIYVYFHVIMKIRAISYN